MSLGFWERTFSITEGDVNSIRVASFGDTALHLVALQTTTISHTDGDFSITITDDNGLLYTAVAPGTFPLGSHVEFVTALSGGFTVSVTQSGTGADQWKLRILYI
jgi:hypothetical protein